MGAELQARTQPGRRLVLLAEELAAALATRAADHDRDGSYPHEAIDALRDGGYLVAPVPQALGGMGVESVHDLVVAASRLARGDASVAIGASMHLIPLVNTAHRWRAATLDLAHFDPVHVIVDGDAVKNVGYDTAKVNALLTTPQAARTLGWQSKVTVGWPSIQNRGDWQAFLGYRHLERDAVLDAFADSGLSMPRAKTLWALTDGPLRPRALAERFDCASATVTDLVDGLEREGLAVRVEDPTDRRAVLVQITPAGRKAAQKALQRKREVLGELFSVLSADEQQHLARLLGRLAESTTSNGVTP